MRLTAAEKDIPFLILICDSDSLSLLFDISLRSWSLFRSRYVVT
jgi:hypothetical protein